MTSAEHSSFAGFTVYAEWYSIRDELARLVGDRAIALFAYSISESYGGRVATAYFREVLEASGEDVDNPQLTEIESLLMHWGRLIASAPHEIDADFTARIAEAFSPKLRETLVAFAGLTVATNLYNTVGRAPVG